MTAVHENKLAQSSIYGDMEGVRVVMRKFIFFLLLLLAPALLSAAEKPNIIFILADDLGWMDIGCQGSRFYLTPAIDQLAKKGIRFTDYYAPGPVCSPSRAAILTGRSPARLGITNITQGKPPIPKSTDILVEPPRKNGLDLSEVTIAEMLAPQGYLSAAIGKWHLGNAPKTATNQGFAYSVAGGNEGSTKYFDPYNVPEIPSRKPGEYITQRLTDEALKFLDEHHDKPFFLYLAHFGVHAPVEAPEDLIAPFRARIQADDQQNNPTYAAAVRAIDDSVAAVVAKVAALGLEKNTIIIFTSDNGGMTNNLGPLHEHLTSNEPLRGCKAQLLEGGLRVPLIVSWPGHIPEGKLCHVPTIGMDFLPTFATLAGADLPKNTPLDGVDISPLLFNEKGTLPDRNLYFHFPHYAWNSPNAAIRSGKWKLIEAFDRHTVELFDLSADIGEKKNLAEQNPEVATSLQTNLDEWLKSVSARMPTINPGYQDAPLP